MNCIALAVSLASFTLAQQVVAPESPAKPTAAITAESYATQVDDAWNARDETAAIRTIQDALRDGLKAYPTDYGLLWRSARLQFWTADAIAAADLKREIAKRGRAFARSAVEANPEGLEGHLYAALNIGMYSNAVGILRALTEGLESEFIANLNFVIARNPSFSESAAVSAKGRYWYTLPWPKRSYAKSATELRRAIAQSPQHLRPHWYLAETLNADGDRAGARRELEYILATEEPGDAPDARRVKALARAMLTQLK